MTTCQQIDVWPFPFLRVLTLSWHLQAPLNLFAVYCIIFESPKAMNNFKWHLFAYQLFSTCLDFTFSMGITPVVIPVMTFGYSAGLYRNILNCHHMLTLSLICMTTSASSIVDIFFWRWQNIILPNSRLKLTRFTYCAIWIFAMSLLFVSIFLIHFALETDQEVMRATMRNIYSCTDFLFQQPAAFFCEAKKYLWVVLYGVVSCCVGCVALILFLQQSLRAISEMAANRSIHAKNVQRKLIMQLCAQLLFPLLAYATGGTTIIISLSLQLVGMQSAFNFAVFTFSNYGLAASVCLIFCNEPYWRRTKRLFCCEFILEKVTFHVVFVYTIRPRVVFI